jgi:hypothetical protein
MFPCRRKINPQISAERLTGESGGVVAFGRMLFHFPPFTSAFFPPNSCVQARQAV